MTGSDNVLFARALADETRQKIMKICCCKWMSVGEIVKRLSVTQPTVSHHLTILKEAGLVNVSEAGKQTFYRLNERRFAACCGRLLANFVPDEAE